MICAGVVSGNVSLLNETDLVPPILDSGTHKGLITGKDIQKYTHRRWT